MRLIIYGSFLVICCGLIQNAVAENRNFKRSRDNEDSSIERPSKHKGEKKYKSKYREEPEDDSDEDFKINLHHKKPWEDHSGGENKYSKYSKKVNVDLEEQTYKKNHKNNPRKNKNAEGSGRGSGKKKSFVAEEESDEDFEETKQNSKQLKKKKFEGASAEITSKAKKYPTKQKKDDDDDDDEDDEEATKKSKQSSNDSEESEEALKKKFRKKIRVRVPDSPEEDSDESDEEDGTCEKKSYKGRGRKGCHGKESANGDGKAEEPARPKKIKYSIKFAHEKEKNVPSEESNIMLKIHRGEKKKYKYQDDDDDDSSEENAFPKRFRFVDDDDD